MSEQQKHAYRTWFKGTLVTHTALHVGTGSVLSTSTKAPMIRGADGLPIIPGSSLKGGMRAASERLLRAMGFRACLVFGESDGAEEITRCLSTRKEDSKIWRKLVSAEPLESAAEKARARAWGLSTDEARTRVASDEALQVALLRGGALNGGGGLLCRSCLTWGSVFMAGRVRVTDLHQEEGSRINLSEIRDGVGLDRDTGTAADRIKFDLEVLPAGARFPFKVVVEPEAELAVVALAIGELVRGDLPIGGRVTRGLGQVSLENLTIEQIDLSDPHQLVPYLVEGKIPAMKESAETLLGALLNPLMEESTDAA